MSTQVPPSRLDSTKDFSSLVPSAFARANAAFSQANNSSVPKITTITYPGDDTAADTGGGQTISISGSGFNIGASVIINGTVASVVTVVSATSLTFTSPAQSAGTYTFYVVNTDGGTAIAVPGISYSGTPSWSTSAGSLGTSYETNAISNTVAATGDATISYSLFSGTLPTGSSLNTSTGAITGTSAALNSPTTYSFVIRATDGQNQDTDRSFSITINPDAVTWISPANNSTTTAYEHSPISNVTLSATSAAGKSITFTANTLPTGVTITGNTISGTPTVVANTNTRLTANTATTFKTATKDINFVVNPDVVSWSSPADGTSIALSTGTVMSNVTLSATSAAGKSITYTANTLPTGVTITGAVVNGTPTVDGTTNSLITATATTTNRTATRNFTWVVSVANDTYFKNTTLLLNGETTVTPFISDASTNSFGLTIQGDTKPVLFSPYTPGYYSNYFDGTGDYLTAPANAAWNFTGDWTFECWIYPTAITGYHTFLGQWGAPDNVFIWKMNSAGRMYLENLSTAITATTTTIVTNQWQHIALTRSSNTIRMFVNGVVDATTATRSGTYYTTTGAMYVGASGVAEAFTGYISNMRILKGTALYTTTFTPPTEPLTAIANTQLLTCQSNRFIDNSTNNFTITKAGDTTVSPAIPFTANSSYSTYGSTYFDGTGDYLTTPTSALNLSTSSWCVEYWMYPTVISSGYYGLWACNSTTGFRQGIYADSGTHYIVVLNGGQGYGGMVLTAENKIITTNRWFHVALACDGTTIRQFINGALTTTGSASTFSAVTPSIGSWATTNYFNGYMSDFRVVKGSAVYTTAFTPPTAPLTAITNTSLLTLQYNGGATNQGIIDNSNFNNIITRNGNTSQGTFSPYSVTGWSNFIGGSANYISTGRTYSFTGDLTIEAWVYWVGGSTFTQYAGIIAHTSGTGVFAPIYIGTTSGTLESGNWGVSGYVGSTGTLNANTWNHVALVRSGTTMRFYINGVQDSSTGTVSGTITTGTLVVGATPIPAYWNGYISNVRIVNGTALYTTTFTPSTAPLTPITNTSLLTCQSNRFIDNSPSNASLTINGTPSVQAFGPFGSIPEAVPISYSNYFDGTGDYLSPSSNTPMDFGTGNFTIEGWFLTGDKSISGGANRMIIGNSGNSYTMQLYIDSSGFLTFGNTGSTFIRGSTDLANNIWNHFAIVRSGTGSGQIKMYVNGIEVASGTNSITYASGTIFIGAFGATDGFWNGYISNLRIIKGTALYTTTFTPPTTPLTAIANTSLLTCQSTRMIDNSTNAFTITANGDTKPRQFNPFGYTAQSATSYTPSLHGGSAYFDGTGDYLTTPNISSWQFGTGNFTVEFWVYPKGNGTIVGLTTSGAGAGYWNAIMSSGNFYWASGVVFRGTSGIDYTNAWHHFAYVRSSGTSKMYIDGINQSSGADSTNYNATVGTLTIGSGDSYGTMNGYISDLRITKGTSLYTSNFVPPTQTIGNYSTSYPSQLLLNFNNGGVIDQHSSNVLETLGNAQLSTAVKKYGNASMYFDGTGDYLYSAPNINYAMGSGDFTIELWYYPVTQNAAWNPNIMGNYNATWTTNKWAFHAPHTTAAGKYSFWVNNIATQPLLASTSNVTNGAWVHLAITRSGSTWRMFVNGTIEATATSSAALDGGTAASMDGLYVGANFYSGEGGRYINAYIDDLRITKGVARYTTTFTPSASGFLTY